MFFEGVQQSSRFGQRPRYVSVAYGRLLSDFRRTVRSRKHIIARRRRRRFTVGCTATSLIVRPLDAGAATTVHVLDLVGRRRRRRFGKRLFDDRVWTDSSCGRSAGIGQRRRRRRYLDVRRIGAAAEVVTRQHSLNGAGIGQSTVGLGHTVCRRGDGSTGTRTAVGWNTASVCRAIAGVQDRCSSTVQVYIGIR